MIPKFRAWYKEWKEMGRVGEIRFDLDGSVSVVLFKGNYLDVSGPREKIVLMQSTGLHDKNGKEIFEGDIIKNGEAVVDVKNHPTLGFYTTPNGVERFFGDNTSIRDFNNDVEDFSDVTEIIGNVYENPELLEVTE